MSTERLAEREKLAMKIANDCYVASKRNREPFQQTLTAARGALSAYHIIPKDKVGEVAKMLMNEVVLYIAKDNLLRQATLVDLTTALTEALEAIDEEK